MQDSSSELLMFLILLFVAVNFKTITYISVVHQLLWLHLFVFFQSVSSHETYFYNTLHFYKATLKEIFMFAQPPISHTPFHPEIFFL